ncbi:hypothetical protein J7K27_06270 [Candidatus Bathyarchaeota archaeon]|nr:hypothetical protein [Candidatus Bathyarchaeota archaeon]
MNPFQKKALLRICEKHGIDTDLIDDSLTFEENKQVLESLTIKTAEDLINWARTLEDMEKLTDLADIYGIPYGFHSETPLIIIRVFVRINRRFLRVFQNRIKPFHKHINEVARGYFKIEGQPHEVANILRKIEDLRPRILRFSKRYDPDWQYLPGFGWIRKAA